MMATDPAQRRRGFAVEISRSISLPCSSNSRAGRLVWPRKANQMTIVLAITLAAAPP